MFHQPSVRFGIDFGGTKTEIIGLDSDNGKELYRKRIPTVRDDYTKTIESFADLVFEAEEDLGMKGTVGMGIPGTMNLETGIMKNGNTLWVVGRPLQKDMELALGREVRIENDANCFAVSEAVDGAGLGAHVVFGAIIGTGCGSGTAINGKAVAGCNNIAGEWGHNPLPYPRMYTNEKVQDIFGGAPIVPSKEVTMFTNDESWAEYPGERCYCGKIGCQENWISGTGFKKDYARVTGEELSTHDVIANSKRGEPKAVAAYERYIDRLARAFSVVINLIDPDVIVVGGGMSNVAGIYNDVPKLWGRYIHSDEVKTQLKSALHGDSSGVRGAAWLWDKAA